MFVIQDHHYDGIERNSKVEFTAKTLVFLRENQPLWCNGKLDQDICRYIETVIEYARSCSIFEALAIQKLVFYKIELGFTLPPQSLYHQSILGKSEFDDLCRVDRFIREYSEGIDFIFVTAELAVAMDSTEVGKDANT